MRDAEQTQRDLWLLRQGTAASTGGVVTDIDFSSKTVRVNSGGVTRVLPWAGPVPFVGAKVRISKLGQQSFCVVSGEGASYGTVQSLGSTTAVVLGQDGVTYIYPYPSGAALSAGHEVALDHARRLVLFRVSALPASSEPPPPDVGSTPTPPPTTSARQTRTFKPTGSANWYSAGGRWDSEYVEISTTRSGYYFYGKQIANTIPDSASIVSARIQLAEVWDKVPGTASQMGVHGYSARPGSGPLGLTGSVAVTGGGSIGLTLAMANALKTGSAFGVGFAQNTGWRRFDRYVRSGALTITWDP